MDFRVSWPWKADRPTWQDLNHRMMPFLALLETDLKGMTRSWVVRIWVGLMIAQALVSIPASVHDESAAQALANQLGIFPLVWSLFVIIISGGAVSSEAGVVADSILSKSVTRHAYILAKLSARLLTVISLFVLITVPAAYLLVRYTDDPLTWRGIAWGITSVGMILVLLVSLAVALSTLFNRTLVAVVVVWFAWYAAGAIFALIGVEYLSPLHIIDNLPDTLQGDYATADQLRILAGFSLPSAAVVGLAILHFTRKDL
jgi:ABC-2 type transport system permease protein